MGLGLASLLLPRNLITSEVLTFGLIADVHKDLMPDADHRLITFIQEANKRDVDMILQLGDFCMAENSNQQFINIWNSFGGAKYHVLGNHDMDRHSKEEMLQFWNMPSTYYSFIQKGVRFIVLDANFLFDGKRYVDYKNANFYVDNALRTFINEEQILWLESELDSKDLPTIICSHQSLRHEEWGVKNRSVIQRILERHKHQILCCLNGHNHLDYHHIQNGINYLDINSASYYWTSDEYKSHDRFPDELYQKYKLLPNLAAYRDPLFAFARIDQNGLHLSGVQSQWIPPSPFEVGLPKGKVGSQPSPIISDFQVEKSF